MKTDEYEIGDEVDVSAYNDDIFHDFSGKIVKINTAKDIITVRDQDDDAFDVDTKQICLT
jgi:hypothetical protein